MPSAIVGKSWLEQLVYSYVGFARGELSSLRVAQDLALEGVGSIGENRVDPRVAGFGAYFWLSWLLSVLAAAVALVHRRSCRLIFAASCLLALGVLNPSAWWARYVPQLWAVPLILGVMALRLFPRKLLWLPVGLAFYLQAVCAQLYLAQSWWLQRSLSQDVTQQRAALVPQLAHAKRITVGVRWFGAHYFWLKEQGYPVERLPEERVQCEHPIDALKMKLCVDPKPAPQ
jgi:hypothetical protein